jgi:hypothetical protein
MRNQQYKGLNQLQAFGVQLAITSIIKHQYPAHIILHKHAQSINNISLAIKVNTVTQARITYKNIPGIQQYRVQHSTITNTTLAAYRILSHTDNNLAYNQTVI